MKTPSSGTVQLGAFYKVFDNYVAARSVSGTYPGLVGPVKLFTYENVPSAYARGIEVAIDQPLSVLSVALSGFGVSANATFVDSQIALRSGSHTALPAASKYTANAALYYATHGLDIQWSVAEVSKSLFSIGGSQATDAYQHQRFTMDLTPAYKIAPNLQVYFNAKNLLNTPLRYDEGNVSRPVQLEYYDITLEGGVRVRF